MLSFGRRENVLIEFELDSLVVLQLIEAKLEFLFN